MVLLVEGAPPAKIHALFLKQKTSVLQQGGCPAALGPSCWGFFPLLLPLEGTSSLQTVLCAHWQLGQAEGGLWDPQSFGLVSKLAARTDTEFTLLHLRSVFAPRWCRDVGQ